MNCFFRKAEILHLTQLSENFGITTNVKMFKASARLLSTLLALTATNSFASELCTLIVDAASGATIVKTGTDCTIRVTPASTLRSLSA